MQDFIDKLENQYQKLISDQTFQENFNLIFNKFLYHQPKLYPGLKRQIIYQHYPITLYRYQSLKKKSLSSSLPPVLIIYAFINRPTILDIQKDRSFIQKLLEHNLDVYLLDWGDPRPQDAQNSLKYYINQIYHAISHILSRNSHQKINLMGICQGGTLSLCTAALYPKKIHKFISIVTPIDFQQSLLSGLLKNIDTQRLINHLGNIPGRLLSIGLSSLKPFRYLKIPTIEQGFFLRMEKWIHDCPDHPGLAFHEFISDFYQKNKLAKSQYFIDKKHIDLSSLKMPILNIYAQQDHLIPIHSATALKDLAGTLDYQALSFSGGHIGIFVSQKALNTIPASIADWLQH